MVHPVLFDSLDAFAGSGAWLGLDGVGIAGGITFRLPAGARSRRNVEGYGSMGWTAALWSPDGAAGGRHVRGLPSVETAEPSKPDPRGGGVSSLPYPFAGSGARRGLDGVGIAGGVTFRLPAGARSRRNVEGYGSMVAFAVFRLPKLPSPRSRPARGGRPSGVSDRWRVEIFFLRVSGVGRRRR